MSGISAGIARLSVRGANIQAILLECFRDERVVVPNLTRMVFAPVRPSDETNALFIEQIRG